MGGSHPSFTCTDDYWLDPPRDLAIVTSGLGVNDYQARPAAVLSLWSIVGEVAEHEGDDALARGARRAHEALERITLGWKDLIRPTAMVAAIRLRGSRAQIAHVGNCRVSRVRPGGLEVLTDERVALPKRPLALSDPAIGTGPVPPGLSGGSGAPSHIVATVRDLVSVDAATNPMAFGAVLPSHLAPRRTAFGAPPADLGARPTSALGVSSDLAVRALDVEPGDELLLTSPAMHERLTSAAIAELCRAERPLVSRAVALMDHGCAHASPFAFVLVRVVPDAPLLGAAGRSVPPSKCFYFAPGEPLPPPVEGLDRGPDQRWLDEIARGLTYGGAAPFQAELNALVNVLPAELAVEALLRAIRWCLLSLGTRFRQMPAPLQALIEAVQQTHTLTDWDPPKRAIEEAFYEWAEEPLGDWASDQAIDKVKDAIDCLVEWARYPERPDAELGDVLRGLVYAEGMWDWDELASEAALSGFGPIPDEYFEMEEHRDEKRFAARRALLLMLAEVAPEPWASGGA